MELLLNLGWLLLAVPAFWLWRESTRSPGQRRFGALQGVFCLACALVILFPVVSATDDLRVMRAEMEESPTGKRSIGQSGSEKSSASGSQTQPALVLSVHTPVPFEHGWLSLAAIPLFTPASPALIRAGRAPPQSTVS